MGWNLARVTAPSGQKFWRESVTGVCESVEARHTRDTVVSGDQWRARVWGWHPGTETADSASISVHPRGHTLGSPVSVDMDTHNPPGVPSAHSTSVHARVLCSVCDTGHSTHLTGSAGGHPDGGD